MLRIHHVLGTPKNSGSRRLSRQALGIVQGALEMLTCAVQETKLASGVCVRAIVYRVESSSLATRKALPLAAL